MTLIVEDGTGKSDAESYISAANADARQTALGNTDWTGSEAVKEAALRNATEYLEATYRQSWKGTRLTRDQALSWPRYGATVDGWDVPSTEVPTEVANACADLAVRALTETLAPDTTRAIIREKVGPLETEYDRNSPQGTSYRAVSGMLAPFLKGSRAMATLVRA